MTERKEPDNVSVVTDSEDENIVSVLTDLSVTADRSPYEEVQHLRELSWVLDDCISIPKTNRSIGIEVLIGMLPIGGDMVSTGYSSYIIYKAYQIGAPLHVLLLMIANVITDSFISLFPGFGAVADAFWKCNQRNVDLLEQYYTGEPITLTQVLKTLLVASLPIVVIVGVLASIITGITFLTSPYL